MQTQMMEPFVFKSIYSWIPSIFTVSDDGNDIIIEDHINGLGPRDRHPSLYRVLEKIFLFALPHFQKTIEFQHEFQQSGPVERWYERSEARQYTTKEDWDNIRTRHHEETLKEKRAGVEKEKSKNATAQQEWSNRANVSYDQEHNPAPPFAGRRLKVIVKAANYVLPPGESYKGTWHLEGMPHERIVASFIYYYETTSNIRDEGLALRRKRDSYSDFPSDDTLNRNDFRVHMVKPGEEADPSPGSDENDYEDSDDEDEDDETDSGMVKDMEDWPSDTESVGAMDDPGWSDLSSYIALGVVPTSQPDAPADCTTGRIISFPNWIQHKVQGVHTEGTDGQEPGNRKILCFFLVDDDDLSVDRVAYPGFSFIDMAGLSVLSTADVPNQSRDCNLPTLYFLLAIMCKRLTGTPFPPELTKAVIDQMDLGMTRTREEAEGHRRALMDERKVGGVGSGHPGLARLRYSLCEH